MTGVQTCALPICLIPPAEEVAAVEPAAEAESAAAPPVEVKSAKIFLVHGRDEAAKHAVARFLETRVGLDVVILSERPNKGRSIFRYLSSDWRWSLQLACFPSDPGTLKPRSR